MASASNTAAQAKVTKAGSSASWPPRAKRRVSTAEENGFTAHTQYSQTLDSCIFHSGYSAVDKRTPGTPQNSSPRQSSRSGSPTTKSTSRCAQQHARDQQRGNTADQNHPRQIPPAQLGGSAKAMPCTTDTTTPASSRRVSSQDSWRAGQAARMLPISRS